MNQSNILIVDDEPEIRDLLSKLLELHNCTVFQAESLDVAFTILNEEEIQVIILDVRLDDVNSIDQIPLIKKKYPIIEIIVLTAYGTINDGVNSIKSGAFDYIVKGDDDDKVLPTVIKALDKNRMSARISLLEDKIQTKFNFGNIIGKSKIIKEAVFLAQKVMDSDTPILLTGETGTGKEIFARAIHYESIRADKPFVAVNCSAIPKDILESELFGYKKGAFTGAINNKKGLFEEADSGTLFLDEIGEMPFNLQAKLLRVLETNSFIKPGDSKETKVVVRIISATNKNIFNAINEESFRKDLFYRISTFIIQLPSLRERKEDIHELADFFLNYYSSRLKKPITSIEQDFFSRLLEYNFPGNIRELKNVCERVVILSERGIITSKNLPVEFSDFSIPLLPDENNYSLEALEKIQIKKILALSENNKQKAAKLLGIGLTTLYRKIEQYGLEE